MIASLVGWLKKMWGEEFPSSRLLRWGLFDYLSFSILNSDEVGFSLFLH